MSQFLLFGATFLCALGCTGKAAPRDSEAIYKDEWKARAEVVDALESVKDPRSAKAAAPRINAACDRLEELANEAKKAPPMSPEEHQKMVDKYLAEHSKLGLRFIAADTTALRNSDGEPDFGKAWRRYFDGAWTR